MKRLFTLSFFLMVTLGSTSFQRQVSAKSSDPNTEITQFEAAFSFALARNDIEQLQRYLADDWKVISGDGNTIDKKRFLQVIASGDLTHAKMTAENPTIRTYGNTALVTAHAQSTGTYKGAAFETHEISTDVIVKIHGRWVCVLTQLTAIAKH